MLQPTGNTNWINRAIAKEAGRYAGRQPDHRKRERVIALRSAGKSIAESARLTGYSVSQVKRIWAETKHGNASASMSS